MSRGFGICIATPERLRLAPLRFFHSISIISKALEKPYQSMRLELESPNAEISFAGNAAVEIVDSNEAAESLSEGIKAAQDGNRGRARMCLKHSAELDARNENTWLWLASISEYPEELLEYLNKVLEINPANPRAVEWSAATNSLLSKNLIQRGIDAVESGQPDAAIEHFNESLGHEPQSCTAWLWLASLSESNEEKIVYLEKVLSIEPENEVATTAHVAAKSASSQKLLAEARNAAVGGNSNRAIALIDVILEEAPGLEDAWILRSHLAESFEEKLRSFEQVLLLNPDNAAARLSVDSLRSIAAAVAPTAGADATADASGELEDSAAVTDEYDASEISSSAAFEESKLEETFVPNRNPTEELKFPEGISEEVQQDMMNTSAKLNADAVTQIFQFSDVESLPLETRTEDSALQFSAGLSEPVGEKTDNFAPEGRDGRPFDVNDFAGAIEEAAPAASLAAQSESEMEISEDGIHMTQPAKDEYASNGIVTNWDESFDDGPSASFSQNDLQLDFVDIPHAFAGFPMPYSALPDLHDTVAPEVNPFESAVLDFDRAGETLAENYTCPFCNCENDAHSFTCASCMAILTLADLEMLLENRQADKFVLRNAVERMEREKSSREFSESELTMLGIGHLNLQNLRAGYTYLKEAAELNPSNAVLSIQANSLLIRLEEMKKRDAANDTKPKAKKILIVDDSPTVRKLIAGKLEKSGHDVFCSNDGVEAMERLQDLVPDLILLDITMPRMDGYQVCKLIRTNEATKNVPVIMISGKDGFFDKVRGRMAGTSGYITKPFGPETLMKAVDTYLQNASQEVQA